MNNVLIKAYHGQNLLYEYELPEEQYSEPGVRETDDSAYISEKGITRVEIYNDGMKFVNNYDEFGRPMLFETYDGETLQDAECVFEDDCSMASAKIVFSDKISAQADGRTDGKPITVRISTTGSQPQTAELSLSENYLWQEYTFSKDGTSGITIEMLREGKTLRSWSFDVVQAAEK